MNISSTSPEVKLSRIFRAIGTPARLQILTAIGSGEACVCHLEAALDLRQAYISQQLMELREAGLLETRREGRYIYYSLVEPRLIESIQEIASLIGSPVENPLSSFNISSETKTPIPHCCCPKCEAAKQHK